MSKQGWTYKKLGEVASLVADGDWIESKDQSDHGIRLIQTGNVGNGIFKSKEDSPHFISEETFSRLGCSEIFEGDCLVSRLPDPVGRACIVPNIGYRMITAVDCSIIRFGNNYLPKFFVNYSQSSNYRISINNNTTGTTRKRISRKNLEKILIPVPPVAEQERIVEELDLLSGIIEKKKEQLKAYDQLAQSIFYTMFGDPITNEKGWEVKKLGEIATIGTGATPSREKEEIYYGGDIHWVKTTEVQNCDITETEETITQLAVDQTNCKVYPPNTLLMAMYGQGKTRGQIAKLRINAATNQACAAILLDFNICHLEYVYELLLIQYEYIRAMAQGGNQANLNMKLVASIPVICPPLSLQQEFAAKIEAIEQQKALIQQSIAEVQTLFDSRMDYWFG